jgi:hypothetical protein
VSGDIEILTTKIKGYYSGIERNVLIGSQLKSVDDIIANKTKKDIYALHKGAPWDRKKAMLDFIGPRDVEIYGKWDDETYEDTRFKGEIPLKQLHEKWEKEEQWPESVPLEVTGSNIKATLQKVIDATKSQEPGDADDLEALRTAINFEADGVKFYKKLSESSPDKKEKSFFNLLAAIENEHLQSLIETEAFFLDPAQWYQQNEHGGLDGV